MKNIYLVIGIIILLVIGVIAWFMFPSTFSVSNPETDDVTVDEIPLVDEATTTPDDTEEAADTDNEPVAVEVIGASAGGNNITAHHYGTGDTEILIVGGIHGGYSWNTSVLAYELMDYLAANEASLTDVKVTVIPVLNPDGLDTVFGSTGRVAASDAPSLEASIPGRFNANNVDLNRNFACEWQASGTWQNRTVSGGTAAFSEPEARAIRDYVASRDITAAVVYYSSAGGVYASNCLNGVLPETTTITETYAAAAGYPAYQEFDYYEITGDMVNWMAAEQIPAISVLLSNHTSTELAKNTAGLESLIEFYSQN